VRLEFREPDIEIQTESELHRSLGQNDKEYGSSVQLRDCIVCGNSWCYICVAMREATVVWQCVKLQLCGNAWSYSCVAMREATVVPQWRIEGWKFSSTQHWPRYFITVGGQNHASAALTPGKQPPVSTEQEAGWVPEPVRTVRKWRISRNNKMVCLDSLTEHFAVSWNNQQMGQGTGGFINVFQIIPRHVSASGCHLQGS
jgi:hypothetical protein